MGNPLIDILAGILAFAALLAIVGFLRNSPLDEIGSGALSFEHGEDDAEAAEIASRHARSDEIRQMLLARSERLERAGQPPLDVEAELARIERGELLDPRGDEPPVGV